MHKITTLLVPFTHTTQPPPPPTLEWKKRNVSRLNGQNHRSSSYLHKKQWKSNAVKCKTFCKVTFILIKPHYTMVCQKTLFWLAGRCALKTFHVQVVPSQFNHRSILIHCFNWCTQTHTHHLHTNTHIFNLNRLHGCNGCCHGRSNRCHCWYLIDVNRIQAWSLLGDGKQCAYCEYDCLWPQFYTLRMFNSLSTSRAQTSGLSSCLFD